MKVKNKYCTFIIALLSVFNSYALNDSVAQLSFADFLSLVKQYHPVAKQAELLPQSAEANSMIAKGSFDPKLFYEFKNKFYDSKNYYELSNAGLKIPTWYGIELKAGFEQNDGSYLNPENKSPQQGLIYSELSVPLLQGLVIDERRTALKQAKLFQELSTIEKTNQVNDLLYKAGKAYWDWQLSYSNLMVYQKAVSISKERFVGISKTAVLGDRPAIDTLEAQIQLQERVIAYEGALLDYKTKSLLLSNYLWLENNVPVEVTDKTIPTPVTMKYEQESQLFSNALKIDSLVNAHPIVQQYELKQKQLNIDKKFKQDKLKPLLNVNYNPLFNADNLNLGYQNNYKWGVSLNFPVFLRKERGEIQQTKIKIAHNQYETVYKRNELMNKMKATLNEYTVYKSQIALYNKNALNYEQLWQSEKKLFDAGESSLFMINSREMSYINAQLKLNDIINKNKKAALDAEYALGLLTSNY